MHVVQISQVHQEKSEHGYSKKGSYTTAGTETRRKPEDSVIGLCKIRTSEQGHLSVPCEPDHITQQNRQIACKLAYSDVLIYLFSNIPGEITDWLIFPLLQAEIGIGTLRLDNTFHIRMPCAHAELERCRLARNPAAYGFSGINATALDCGKDVERPEDPIMNNKLRLL